MYNIHFIVLSHWDITSQTESYYIRPVTLFWQRVNQFGTSNTNLISLVWFGQELNLRLPLQGTTSASQVNHKCKQWVLYYWIQKSYTCIKLTLSQVNPSNWYCLSEPPVNIIGVSFSISSFCKIKKKVLNLEIFIYVIYWSNFLITSEFLVCVTIIKM